MAGVIATVPKYQFSDSTGTPLAGGTLTTYVAGTTTLTNTWQDQALTTLNTNPIVLDSRGECVLWLSSTVNYKLVLKNAVGVTQWTVDNISGADNGLRDALAASSGSTLVSYTQGGTGAVTRTVQSKLRESVSVKDFGAVGDGVTDDTAALAIAVTAAAASGAALYLPAGTYLYTTKLTIPGGLNVMYGDGASSILKPTGCDGMEFTNQSVYAGSRSFRDFFISGSGTAAFTGLICNMTAASGNRVTGITFSNITIQNFKQGTYLRGIWDSMFINCYWYNNYQGVLFEGQNIRNQFWGGSIQRGAITGTGTTYGVRIITIAGESTQSTSMFALGVYAYDINVSFGLALLAQMIACDISVARSIGIQIITVTGGLTVRDCWVQTLDNATFTRGIVVEARGVAEFDKITIENNEVIANNANTSGSVGIVVGINQNSVSVSNNRVEDFEIGITLGAANSVCNGNSINAGTTAIRLDSSAAVRNEIGPNIIQNGTPLVFTSGSLQPTNLKYWADGSFTMALTGMTAGVNATIAWASHGNVVMLSMVADATGTSNTTAMLGTGMPQEIRPASTQAFQAACVDSGVGDWARAVVTSAAGTVTFSKNLDGGVFTASGTKGLRQSTMSYVRG